METSKDGLYWEVCCRSNDPEFQDWKKFWSKQRGVELKSAPDLSGLKDYDLWVAVMGPVTSS